MDRTKIFLHAKNPLNLAGAMTLLRGHPEIVVLGDRDLRRADVLVVVEDAMLEETIAAIRHCHETSEAPDRLRCVIVTDRFRPGDLMPALDRGTVSVMSLPEAPAQLAAAILNAHDGTIHLPPDLQGALLTQLRRLRQHVLEPSGMTMSGFSTRECEVLRLLSEGFDTEVIAARLNYSERTVKNVLYGLMARLGLKNRAHAVAYAIRTGAI